MQDNSRGLTYWHVELTLIISLPSLQSKIESLLHTNAEQLSPNTPEQLLENAVKVLKSLQSKEDTFLQVKLIQLSPQLLRQESNTISLSISVSQSKCESFKHTDSAHFNTFGLG